MSRAQTLVLALLALHLLLGTLCLVIARGEHRSPALRWWGWGTLLYAFGLLVTISQPFIPRPAALTLGNTLIAIAPVLCVMGVLFHTKRRMWKLWVGVGTALAVAVLVANNFIPLGQALLNLVAPTPMAVILFLVGAFWIVIEGPPESEAANRFLAATMVLAVVMWVARVAAMLSWVQGSGDAERIDLVISLFAIAQIVIGVASTMALIWIDVRLMQAQLARVADSDALTGLPNRRAARQRFDEEVARAARRNEKFALAVFDVDHFKRVNDKHGHAVGDQVLAAVGAAFAAAKRNEDVIARIGGEEFLVILPQPTIEGARDAADRLRAAVARAEVAPGGERISLTASGGVALYPDDGRNWDQLFAAADRRLYEAKRAGRDRVVASDAPRSARAQPPATAR